MEQDNVSKEFAGLVGDEWHEWIVPPKKDISSRFECSCGIVGYDGRDADLHIAGNNLVYIIEHIKARIQAVPCGECNGMGDVCEVNDQCKEDLPEHGICPTTGLPARCYDNTLDCTCTDGKRDDMPAFMVWLWSYCLVLAANNNTTVQFQFWNLLTTPALLMQAYIAYRRQA